MEREGWREYPQLLIISCDSERYKRYWTAKSLGHCDCVNNCLHVFDTAYYFHICLFVCLFVVLFVCFYDIVLTMMVGNINV